MAEYVLMETTTSLATASAQDIREVLARSQIKVPMDVSLTLVKTGEYARTEQGLRPFLVPVHLPSLGQRVQLSSLEQTIAQILLWL
jgi:hypothetical protein